MLPPSFRSLVLSSTLIFSSIGVCAQTCVGATADANLAALNIPVISFSGQFYKVTFNLVGYYQGNPVYRLGAVAGATAPTNA